MSKWLGWIAAGALAFAWLTSSLLQAPQTARRETSEPSAPRSAEPFSSEERIRSLEVENAGLREALRRQSSIAEESPREKLPEAPEIEEASLPPTPSADRDVFATVEGLVLAGGSHPVPGVSIRIDEPRGLHQEATISRSDGWYRLMVPAGEYVLQLRVKEGKVRPPEETLRLAPGERLRKDFLIEQGLVEVPVLDWETRAPIANLESLPRLRNGDQEYEPETFRDGKLQFLGLPDGRFEPRLKDKEYSLPDDAGLSVIGGRAEPLLLISLPTLRLCFVDAKGNPFRGTIFAEFSARRNEQGEEEWVSYPDNLHDLEVNELNRSFRISFRGMTGPLSLAPEGCHSSKLAPGRYRFRFKKSKPLQSGDFVVFRNFAEAEPFFETEVLLPQTGTVHLRVDVP